LKIFLFELQLGMGITSSSLYRYSSSWGAIDFNT